MDAELGSIYHSWQRTVWGMIGKPFKYRRDFSDLEKRFPSKVVALTKLRSILRSLNVTNPDLYFRAPYEVCDDYSGRILQLEFYARPRAIRLFSNYREVMSENEDDTKEQKNSVDIDDIF